MRVVDESMWQAQCAELEVNEIGQRFRQFLEAWVDEAEVMVTGANRRIVTAEYEDIPLPSPAEAIRAALAPTEEKLGRVDTLLIGQMLVVIAANWAHGEAMVNGLSPVEMRVLQDALALKIRELAAHAAAEGRQEGEVTDDTE